MKSVSVGLSLGLSLVLISSLLGSLGVAATREAVAQTGSEPASGLVADEMMIASADAAATSYILVERLNDKNLIRFSICEAGLQRAKLPDQCYALGTQTKTKIQERSESLATQLKWARRALNLSIGVSAATYAYSMKRTLGSPGATGYGIAVTGGLAIGLMIGKGVDYVMGVPDLSKAQDVVDSLSGSVNSESHIVVVSSLMSDLASSLRLALDN